MNTYPNQKVITVKKAEANKNNIYAVINKDCLFKAMRELKPNELKVYLYLSSNQDGFTLALSTADIAESTGADKRKIQAAITSLIEKGYLKNTEGNKFEFVE